MANQNSFTTFLLACLFTCVLGTIETMAISPPALAQQTPDTELTAVQWDTMAGAKTYSVTIAKDRSMTTIVTQTEVPGGKTQYQAKDLAAGTYYVVVKGFSGSKEVVGITAPLPLVIGAAFTVTGNRFGLPPPHLLDPPSEARLAPEIKIRFVWSRVAEASRYRFRISKETDDKSQLQLLWETETDRNYIELTDVPPTSYRYFREGRYRWQVACLNGPKGESSFEGDQAEAFFNVSKDVLLEKLNDDGEMAVTVGAGIFKYSGTSGVTTNVTNLNGSAQRWGLDLRHWFNLHSGFFISGNLTTIQSPQIKGVLKSINSDYMLRSQLSNTTAGWGFAQGWNTFAGLGLGLRQDLQVDDASTKSFPLNIGLHWRWGLTKNMNDHWSAELLFSGLFALITYRGGGNDDPIGSTITQLLSADASLQLAYLINPTTKLRFGIQGYNYRSQYEQVLANTTNTMQGFFGSAGLSFLF